jgi:transposase InsO family protein
VRFAFVEAEKVSYPVSVLCRVLEVSRTGFYAWVRRPPSAQATADQQLGVRVVAIHRRSRGTYGAPRVHAELQAEGTRTSRKRVARLMRRHQVAGRRPTRWRRTTDSRHGHAIAPNRLARRFTVDAPNRVWVADLTYIWTWEGWLYLAVIVDLFARRVVGWALADHLRTDLALDALRMAVGRRRPPAGLVHHSDRGVQYASEAYRTALDHADMVSSMSRKADCWDNAVAESFFGTVKTELIEREPWATRRQARAATIDYIEGFYNSRRRHSFLGYRSPLEFEHVCETAKGAAA